MASPESGFILSPCLHPWSWVCMPTHFQKWSVFYKPFCALCPLPLSPAHLFHKHISVYLRGSACHHLVPLLHPHWYCPCANLPFFSLGQLQKPPWSHPPTHTLTSFMHCTSSSRWKLTTEQHLAQSTCLCPLCHILSSLSCPCLWPALYPPPLPSAQVHSQCSCGNLHLLLLISPLFLHKRTMVFCAGVRVHALQPPNLHFIPSPVT